MLYECESELAKTSYIARALLLAANQHGCQLCTYWNIGTSKQASKQVTTQSAPRLRKRTGRYKLYAWALVLAANQLGCQLCTSVFWNAGTAKPPSKQASNPADHTTYATHTKANWPIQAICKGMPTCSQPTWLPIMYICIWKRRHSQASKQAGRTKCATHAERNWPIQAILYGHC
jgi:hypothetical protein